MGFEIYQGFQNYGLGNSDFAGRKFQNYGSGFSEQKIVRLGRGFQNKMALVLGRDFQNWKNGD